LNCGFASGRIVDVQASANADVLRAQLGADEGAAYLGEVALVGGSSRLGELGITFLDSMYDENAACHIGYGRGLTMAVEGGDALSTDELRALGFNQSAIHEDVMIGGAEVEVVGLIADADEVPVLRHGHWLLDVPPL
jgi:aminopeptidase